MSDFCRSAFQASQTFRGRGFMEGVGTFVARYVELSWRIQSLVGSNSPQDADDLFVSDRVMMEKGVHTLEKEFVMYWYELDDVSKRQLADVCERSVRMLLEIGVERGLALFCDPGVVEWKMRLLEKLARRVYIHLQRADRDSGQVLGEWIRQCLPTLRNAFVHGKIHPNDPRAMDFLEAAISMSDIMVSVSSLNMTPRRRELYRKISGGGSSHEERYQRFLAGKPHRKKKRMGDDGVDSKRIAKYGVSSMGM